MKWMRANTFKSRCLTVIEEVQATGEPVMVTSNGKPIVKIVPIESETDDLFGFTAGKVKIIGDIEAPTGAWKVAKRYPHRGVARHGK